MTGTSMQVVRYIHEKREHVGSRYARRSSQVEGGGRAS
jgi:hypothetical protein